MIANECCLIFGRAGPPAPDPVGDEFRLCRLRGVLHRVQRAGRYGGARVLGFQPAHYSDGDAGPASEALLLATKQRADGMVPLVFYHEQFISV